jgi:hypothetical protein
VVALTWVERTNHQKRNCTRCGEPIRARASAPSKRSVRAARGLAAVGTRGIANAAR